MDIGVLTVPLGGESIEDAVAYLDEIGVDAVELGVGGWPGEGHVDREALLDDDAGQAEIRELLDEHDLRISALATHNNPLHPDEERAAEADRELREVAFPRGAVVVAGHDSNQLPGPEMVLEPGSRYVVAIRTDISDEVVRLFRG